jgi:hypothetical protein
VKDTEFPNNRVSDAKDGTSEQAPTSARGFALRWTGRRFEFSMMLRLFDQAVAQSTPKIARRFEISRRRVFAFLKSLMNGTFAFLAIVFLPLFVQLFATNLVGTPISISALARECYALALGTSLSVFAELRFVGDNSSSRGLLGIYHELLHWLAPIGAGAMAFALLALFITPTSDLAQALALHYRIVVWAGLVMYFTYKVPTLWAASGIGDEDAEAVVRPIEEDPKS